MRVPAARGGLSGLALLSAALLAVPTPAAAVPAVPVPAVDQGAADGDPTVRRLRLRVGAESVGADPRVELEYRLRVPAATEEIPLRGLAFAGTDVSEVEAWLDGRPVDVRLRRSRPLVRSGAIRLPPAGGAAGTGDDAAGDRRVRVLRLAYRVEGPPGQGAGRSFDLRVPVLRVDWPPSGSGEGTFRGEVVVPSDARVTDRLPTVPMSREAAGERAVYRFQLPAVPSIIRLRGRMGPSPGLTLGQWVDLSVLATLALLGLLGWRLLRRS